MSPSFEIVLQLFGPLAALALGVWVLFRWMKPRLEAAENEQRDRIGKLEAQVEQYIKERDEARQTTIRAFGDVADGFTTLADDVRDLIESTMDHHETRAGTRHTALLARLEDHKKSLLTKLDRATDDKA